MEPLPVELMNTVRADRDGVHDTIADPAAAARWLREARPEAGIPGWEAAAELRDLRDALRQLAAAATGDDREATAELTGHWMATAATGGDREAAAELTGHRMATAATGGEVAAGAPSGADLEMAVAVVNRACARAPSWSELHWPDPGDSDDEPRAATRTAHSPALAAIAAIAEEAVALFAGPDRLLLRACHAPGCVLYFIRNHPRRAWCSDGCGNRARVARHYRRHHGGSTEGG
ncbi:CGNR zinc finger domain-containing protein [Dactylosporangium sp. NPDC005555]|uniref:CGNR zinc finger domain-containing protein n=1 Tax=Dactylosporangium sp. NPDC005555 TaxID=3154889 RepID=UPI0033BBEB5A